MRLAVLLALASCAAPAPPPPRAPAAPRLVLRYRVPCGGAPAARAILADRLRDAGGAEVSAPAPTSLVIAGPPAIAARLEEAASFQGGVTMHLVDDAVDLRPLLPARLPEGIEIHQEHPLRQDGHVSTVTYLAGPAALLASLPVRLPPGRRLGIAPGEPPRTYVIEEAPAFDARGLEDVTVDPRCEPAPCLRLHWNEAAMEAFAQLTGAHVRDRIAIVVDGLVMSAPVIMERIRARSIQLSLGASPPAAELERTASRLRAKPLPCVLVLEEQTIR